MKLLLWSAVALMVVMWLFRNKKISSSADGKHADKAADASRDIAEPMLPCAHCGVHVPASEAVLSSSGAAFCTQEHRLRHGES